MRKPLFRLIYCSKSRLTPANARDEIQRILDVARVRNAEARVSGALLYTEATFAQVLEGPQQAVEDIFERIQCDPRHADAHIIEAKPIVTRAFRTWGMDRCGPGALQTQLAVDQAFAKPAAQSGDDVLGLLRSLMAREKEWA